MEDHMDSRDHAHADGWAVCENGRIGVDTVSPTRIAAMVNGLVTVFGKFPLHGWSDARIESEWDRSASLGGNDRRLEVVRVVILPAALAPPTAGTTEAAGEQG